MRVFLVAEILVGAFTAYFFGVDTALQAGKRLVDIWIVAGLVLTFLEPVFEIFHFFQFIVQMVFRFFHRKNA